MKHYMASYKKKALTRHDYIQMEKKHILAHLNIIMYDKGVLTLLYTFHMILINLDKTEELKMDHSI